MKFAAACITTFILVACSSTTGAQISADTSSLKIGNGVVSSTTQPKYRKSPNYNDMTSKDRKAAFASAATEYYLKCAHWPISDDKTKHISINMLAQYDINGRFITAEALDLKETSDPHADLRRAEAALLFHAALIRCGYVPLPSEYYKEWREILYEFYY